MPMADAFTRLECGWHNVAGTKPPLASHDPSSSSSLFQSTRQPHRLSHEFSAAASPASPSLDDIRARLHEVMRSIDDTLSNAASLPAPPFDIPPPLSRTVAGRDAATEEELPTAWTRLGQRPPTHPSGSHRAGPSGPSAALSTAAASSSSFLDPPVAPASVSWPSARVAADLSHSRPLCKQRERPPEPPQSLHPSPKSRAEKDEPHCTTAETKGRRSYASTVSKEGAVESSAATDLSAGTALSATYKATLDFWRAGSGGHCAAHQRAPTEEHRACAGTAARSATVSPAFSLASAPTTASKYVKPPSHENFTSGAAAAATASIMATATCRRPSNMATDTLTSMTATLARPSQTFSPVSLSSPVREGQHTPLPSQSGPPCIRSIATDADGQAATKAVTTTQEKPPTVLSAKPPVDTSPPATSSPTAGHPPSTLISLPPPSAVPSLSARLAVLRATDARQQRAPLLPRGGDHRASPSASGAVEGDAERRERRDLRDDMWSALHRGANSAEGPSTLDDDPCRYRNAPAALHRDATVLENPVTHLTSPHTRDRRAPFSPSPSQRNNTYNNASNTNIDTFHPSPSERGREEERQTGACGINVSHHSDVLVRSPDTSRGNSPGTIERRNRREARQDETSHIVALALDRQAAAEEAWRECQTRLLFSLPPPRPSSAPPTSVLLNKGSDAFTLTRFSDKDKKENGGEDAGTYAGCSVATAPLDALQARLVLRTASSESGVLPLQEELAVRERLAARRNGERAISPRDSLENNLLVQRRRQEQDSYVRFSEARDREPMRHLKSEVARQTKVQSGARARMARVQANIPAGEASGRGAEELQAIRAHAEQLERLRQKMRREKASASSSSTLNTPQVVLPPPSTNLAQHYQSNWKDAPPPTSESVLPTDAQECQMAALADKKVTTLSTAAALTPTSVEFDMNVGDNESKREKPLSRVSASSVEDLAPTPERMVSPRRNRPSSLALNAERKISNKGYNDRPSTSSACAKPQNAQDARRESSGSDDADSRDVSRHDLASATQLPPSRPPPAEPASPPNSLTSKSTTSSGREGERTQHAAPLISKKGSPTEVASSNSPIVLPASISNSNNNPQARDRTAGPSANTDEPPSPLPIKPSISDTPRQYGAKQDDNAVTPNNPRTFTGLAAEQERRDLRTTPLRPSLPVEDAEHDIISSSPSAARHPDTTDKDSPNCEKTAVPGGSDGCSSSSLTPERLASIQSTRLHVSPVRGTAWQDGFTSAHPHGRPTPLLSSFSSDSSSLPDGGSSSPFVSRPKGTSYLSAPKKSSQTHLRRTSVQPSHSPVHGASPAYALTSTRYSSASSSAAAHARPADPLRARERAMQHETNKCTAARAQAMLMEHGVFVGVQLANRRLPALVRLSGDKQELLFYLERITETAEGAPSPSLSSTPRARSFNTPPRSSMGGSQPLLLDGARRPMPVAAAAAPVRHHGAVFTPPLLIRQQPRFPLEHPQQPQPSPPASLYSVSPSVRLREGAKALPGAALAKPKVMTGPPPPSFVKLPPGTVFPSTHRTGATHLVPTSPPQHPQVQFQSLPPPPLQTPPSRFGTPAPQNLHPNSILQPRPGYPPEGTHRVAGPSRAPSQESLQSHLSTTLPRVMHVRELHHFPCRYARIYVPYGVMGYEVDCGFGGPGTWEDVSGVLCGPASYEVLRRYSCPLFARMRGRDYVPYRVYVIIPEFQRVDVPQNAVLLVLDFKQRVDWVLFLLAMQLNMTDSDNGGVAGSTSSRAAKTPSRVEKRSPVLSYGRALWMLAVQRLQRARALRGLNTSESHLSARQDTQPPTLTTPPSPPEKRRASQRRTDEETKKKAMTSVADPRRKRSTRASLRFAPPTATPASLLRSPQQSRRMEGRPAQQQQQPSSSPSLSVPPQSSPRRVPSPAAPLKNAAAYPTLLSDIAKKEQARQRNELQAASLQQSQKMEESFNGQPTNNGDCADDVQPLSAEETLKPRFRWYKRIAHSLNSSRRSLSASKQPTSKREN